VGGRGRAPARHFVFHPTLPIVYLLNELDATVDTLAFDSAARTLRGSAWRRRCRADSAAARRGPPISISLPTVAFSTPASA
jgi:hypothetical protein